MARGGKGMKLLTRKVSVILLGIVIVGLSANILIAAEKKATKLTAYKVTFIELGSVNCIPCKAMQPVMKEIEQEYGKQVKVVFYDVWTKEGSPFGDQYKIRAIPTQVFLDKDGKEYFRHIGFFPKEEIIKVLQKQGVK
jgi:thioredoxin 1